MPIEDVDFLIQNCVKDAVTFFVDSSRRDFNFNPEPNNFVLTFSEPIRNVFGIEILDATIPVTMWTIDTINCALAYSHVHYFNGVTSTQFKQYFQELEFQSIFNTVFESKAKANIFVCLDRTNFETILSSQASTNIAPLIYSQHIVLYRKILTGDVQKLGMEVTKVDDDNTIVFEHDRLYYSITNPSAEVRQFLNQSIKEFSVLTDFSGIVTYEHVYITRPQAIDILNMAATGYPICEVYINNEYTLLERGVYDATSILQYMTSIFQAVRVGNPAEFLDPQDSFTLTTEVISVGQTSTYGTVQKQTKLAFSFPGASNCLIFDMTKSTCNKELGFYGHAKASESQFYNILSSKRNQRLFMSITKSSASGDKIYQSIQAPGIINLQGVRYILLKIPELESHILNSYAYGDHSPGIGMFKLTATNEVAQLRFDFVNLVRKPFHPIGKLTKITLQFVMSDGTPYDFKGVDYNLLLAVKFYAPMTGVRPPKSILNPNYDPDYLAYNVKSMAAKKKKNYTQKDILLEQNKYDM